LLQAEPGGDAPPPAEPAASEREIRHDRLGELLDELEAEYGPVPPEVREQTRRMWPNYEEDHEE
jgi:hypothetical protein